MGAYPMQMPPYAGAHGAYGGGSVQVDQGPPNPFTSGGYRNADHNHNEMPPYTSASISLQPDTAADEAPAPVPDRQHQAVEQQETPQQTPMPLQQQPLSAATPEDDAGIFNTAAYQEEFPAL
jgi:hypothetical protein